MLFLLQVSSACSKVCSITSSQEGISIPSPGNVSGMGHFSRVFKFLLSPNFNLLCLQNGLKDRKNTAEEDKEEKYCEMRRIEGDLGPSGRKEMTERKEFTHKLPRNAERQCVTSKPQAATRSGPWQLLFLLRLCFERQKGEGGGKRVPNLFQTEFSPK